MALQMSWQPTLLHHKRKSGGPLGLRNLGNSCYLNSVLQCLTYTPPLANFCIRNQHSSLCDSASEPGKTRDCPFCILEKRIARSLTFDLTLDSPSKILNSLRIYAEHFKSGRQEDAHEFLRYVIDACHNTCLKLKKLQQQRKKGGNGGAKENSKNTTVSEIFGGALQSQVKCLACGAESNKLDEIMDLSLDVLHSNSLKDAIQKFFQPEILDGSNKYKCDKCKKLVTARKQMSILQAPNVLVVQLKRFEGIFGGKIDKAIAFEESLLLSGFMCKGSQDPCPRYSLFGTIVHSGFSPESGHYYAYVKDATGRWFCCNDSYVTHSALQEVLSEKAYVLFFTRTNQRAGLSAASPAANGVESNGSNGNKAVRSPKAAAPLKTVNIKPSAGSSLAKAASTEVTVTKDSTSLQSSEAVVNKSSSSLRSKFNGLANSLSRKALVNGNDKIDSHKVQHYEAEKNLRNITNKENKQSPAEVDGIVENGKNGSFDHDSPRGLANGNGHIPNGAVGSAEKDGREDGEIRGTDSAGKISAKGAAHSHGAVNGHFATCSLKRKLEEEDSRVLLGEVVSSQTALEKFKESLVKEASSGLQSCGWTDAVYEYMRSQKRLRAGDIASLTTAESKDLLIEGAKQTFLSEIPPSLKQGLISRLRAFSWDV